MASPKTHFLLLLLLLHLHFSPSSSSSTTTPLTTLIYKGCANQNFQNPLASENLKSLFQALISQSATSNFYKTTTTSFTGLYLCRGDLSHTDCTTCVTKLPNAIQKLCAKTTIAARVQLAGCYMRYEIAGFPQAPATELLYKRCGSRSESGEGFGERLEAALELVVKGVGNGRGYYAGGYESVYVLGQCEGDMGGGECVNCVKAAAEIGRSQCGSSISGHVYLQRCYVSYTYYPDGVPGAGNFFY